MEVAPSAGKKEAAGCQREAPLTTAQWRRLGAASQPDGAEPKQWYRHEKTPDQQRINRHPLSINQARQYPLECQQGGGQHDPGNTGGRKLVESNASHKDPWLNALLEG